MEKTCNRCGETKLLEFFHKSSRSKDGHYSLCKECKIATTKIWKEKNKAHIREYKKKRYWSDPELARLQKKASRDRNKEETNKRRRERRKANPDYYRLQKQAWVKANPEKVKKQNAENYKRHSEKIKERARLYSKNNREKCNEIHRKCYAKNKDKYRAYSNSWIRDNIDKVTSYYAKMLLCANGSILSFDDVPDSLVESKRQEIILMRKIKKLEDEKSKKI